MHDPFALSVLLGACAALANVAGGLTVVLHGPWDSRRLAGVISVGAGFMMAASTLRMAFADESAAAHVPVPMLILGGYFLVHLFQHSFAHHFHVADAGHSDRCLDPAAGVAAFAGLMVHATFDGIAIGSALHISFRLGLLIFFAIILHKVPEGMTVSSIMLGSGSKRATAMGSAIGLGLFTLAGTLIIEALSRTGGPGHGEVVARWALALSAGVLIYVAASDVIPEINRGRRLGLALLVMAGAALFIVTEHVLGVLGL
jgi:ZIP family zinc transporter/zinc and cadmium transporter